MNSSITAVQIEELDSSDVPYVHLDQNKNSVIVVASPVRGLTIHGTAEIWREIAAWAIRNAEAGEEMEREKNA